MRKFEKLAAAAGVALLGMLGLVGAADAAGTLRILTWDGYADKDWVQEFEKANDCKVEVVFASTGDEMWAKIQGSAGKDFDMFALSSNAMDRYYEAGLLQPLDMSKISNHAGQLPQFQDLASIQGATHDGKTYLVPYAFSPLTLIYDPSKVTPAPDSWSVLWDSKYQGKVLMYDDGEGAIALAGIVNGVKRPFVQSNDELSASKAKLVDLKHQVAGFYTNVDESVQLMQTNDIALVYGAYADMQLKAMKKAGLNSVMTYPKEGVTAWVDTWAVTSGAKDESYDLALKWINFLISKEKSDQLTERTGYANSVTSKSAIPEGTKIFWMEPDEDPSKRTDIWNEVKATP